MDVVRTELHLPWGMIMRDVHLSVVVINLAPSSRPATLSRMNVNVDLGWGHRNVIDVSQDFGDSQGLRLMVT